LEDKGRRPRVEGVSITRTLASGFVPETRSAFGLLRHPWLSQASRRRLIETPSTLGRHIFIRGSGSDPWFTFDEGFRSVAARRLRRGGRSHFSARGRIRMVVGIVRFELHLPGAQSLKDKRQVVRSIKERIRERVRASVAEVEYQDLWQRAAIGFAVVAADGAHVHELLNSARHIVEGYLQAQVLDWQETLQ
jgi:uncharacterized protein YlxP (DUF503 family)